MKVYMVLGESRSGRSSLCEGIIATARKRDFTTSPEVEISAMFGESLPVAYNDVVDAALQKGLDILVVSVQVIPSAKGFSEESARFFTAANIAWNVEKWFGRADVSLNVYATKNVVRDLQLPAPAPP